MSDAPSADRTDWARMLDRLTKEHEGQLVTIEILDPLLGDQYEAERLPFAYATYDPKGDLVIVAVGGRTPRFPVVLRHMITRPAQVSAAQDAAARAAFRVVDEDGTATLVRFFPAAAAS